MKMSADHRRALLYYRAKARQLRRARQLLDALDAGQPLDHLDRLLGEADALRRRLA